MVIHIQNVIPIPLKDKLMQRPSDIWNKDSAFSQKDFIKIKAPSGTGKTTLIHYLYALRNDYMGTVNYDGVDAQKIPIEQMSIIRQQKLSIIFQDLRLFQHLTALENIEVKRTMSTPIYTIEKVKEMAATLGVMHILNQPAKICSYGEQQRIAIIRALMQPFEWLLMDEPFSHLDQANSMKAAQLIAEECTQRNAGFILTDLDEDTHFNYTKYLTL
jgi:ABC-type lipoprotein export system ATPase subunit